MKYKFAFFLLILLTSAEYASAQTGSTCSTAIPLIGPSSNLTNESAIGTRWYALNVDTGEVYVEIVSLGTGDTTVQAANVYSGPCTSLVSLTTIPAQLFPLRSGHFHNSIPNAT